MNCKNCIHWDKCSKTNGKTRYYGETIASDNVEELCKWFISTADVVPKSEVDSLKVELEDRVYTINSLGEYLEKSKSEVEELKAIIADCKANEERWQDLYADTVDKWEKAYEELEIKLENSKAEVAMEIFEEIERETKNHGIAYAQRKIAELKKKYTENLNG